MAQNQNNSLVFDNKKLISQRYLDSDEENFSTEEKTRGNILSSIIENRIEFYSPIENGNVCLKTKNRIKLFADFKEVVDIDKKFISKPQIKPKISKRIVEPDVNPMSKADKIKSVVIDPSFILEKTDSKHWNDRKKSKTSKYKSKTGNPYQFVEPENEFSKIRKKNCWSEKRISRTFKK